MQRNIDRTISARGFYWLALLGLILAACSGNSSTPASNTSKGQPTTPNAISTAHTIPTSTIKLGPQPCPAAVASPSHWDSIIGTQSSQTKVETVTCGNLMGLSSLQAVVTARTSGMGALLDVYIYNHITDPTPTKVFALMSLYKGEMKISTYNTLLTTEVDQNSSVNQGKADAALVLDLSREFKWSDRAGALIPIAFPGIFPDLTRYQAEGDQQAVNQGNSPWKLDATMVASHFATTLLQWPSNSPATIVSGGGPNDEAAVVSVKGSNPGGGSIKLTMDRLENNTNGGIWIVTSATSSETAITEPDPNKLSQISSPVTVQGKGNAFEAVIGKVFVLDHNYNQLGTADAHSPAGAQGMGNTTFSTSLSYTSTFTTGSQDGLVVLYSYSNANGSIASIGVSKVLIK